MILKSFSFFPSLSLSSFGKTPLSIYSVASVGLSKMNEIGSLSFSPSLASIQWRASVCVYEAWKWIYFVLRWRQHWRDRWFVFDADDMRACDAFNGRAAREREKRKLDFNDTKQYTREMPITSNRDRSGINSTSIQIYLHIGRTSINGTFLLIDSPLGQRDDGNGLCEDWLNISVTPFPSPFLPCF